MMITTIFIDLDGTLLRRLRNEFLEKSAKLLGVSSQEYYDAYHWVYVDYTRGKIKNDDECYKLILKNLGRPPNHELMRKLHKIFMDSFEVYPQTHRVLESLKQKYKLVMLSNHVSSWVDVLLERFRLRDYFEQVIVSDKVGVRKPDPGVYRIALNKAGVRPEECALIDDKSENVEAASKMGIRGILVDPKFGIPEDIDKRL